MELYVKKPSQLIWQTLRKYGALIIDLLKILGIKIGKTLKEFGILSLPLMKSIGELILALLRRSRVVPLAILGVAILVTVVLLLQTRTPKKDGSIAISGEATPTPTLVKVDPTLVSSNPQVMALEENLLDLSLDKEARESVEKKLELAKQLAAEEAAGIGQPRKEKQAPPLPKNPSLLVTPARVLDQIYEGSQGMIRPSMATISNCWQGTRNGRVWEIYAGAQVDDPTQGLLLLYASDAENGTRTMLVVKAPGKTGQLRILSVNGAAVTLQGANETQYTFSLKTMKFE